MWFYALCFEGLKMSNYCAILNLNITLHILVIISVLVNELVPYKFIFENIYTQMFLFLMI